MRELFLDKHNTAIKVAAQPHLDDESVLVAVHYSLITSGGQIARIAHAQDSLLFSNVPQKVKKVLEAFARKDAEDIDNAQDMNAFGYSCSGRVIAIGKRVTKVRPGDFVACMSAGFASTADFVCISEQALVKISDKTKLKEASIVGLGACALRGLKRAKAQLGETVCVMGLGLIGQLTVQLAKRAGCKVIAVDTQQKRLDLAVQSGADYAYALQSDDVVNQILYSTDHIGVHTTIITPTLEEKPDLKKAVEITRKKGSIVLVGDASLEGDRGLLFRKEIDFLMSSSYIPGAHNNCSVTRWTENNLQIFLELIESNAINVDTIIAAEIPLNQINGAYDVVQHNVGKGIIVSYPQQMKADMQRVKEQSVIDAQSPRYLPAVKDTIRVGVIGAGVFAQQKLMPVVSKLKNISMNAIVDIDVTNSIEVAQMYGVQKYFASDEALWREDLVDAVMIASPHKFHCDQALNALQHGKAVFMEKPMVTDAKQYERLGAFLKTHPQAPLCIDYNRSFAPFIQKIKETISHRHSPLVVHYRMNAGLVSNEHWIHSSIGAGRIIGDACHIFDLFCHLTDSKPIAVSVETVATSDSRIFPTDNFSANISFEDGSLCSLLYTSLGHNALHKERMELFYDSKAIVMEDYEQLIGYGLPKSFNDAVTMPERGHEHLINAFFDAVRKKKSMPISIDRLQAVTQLTLIVDELACQGGGSRTVGA